MRILLREHTAELRAQVGPSLVFYLHTAYHSDRALHISFLLAKTVAKWTLGAL